MILFKLLKIRFRIKKVNIKCLEKSHPIIILALIMDKDLETKSTFQKVEIQWLVFVQNKCNIPYNIGKLLRAQDTPYYWETFNNRQGNDLVYRNNS